MARPKLSEAVTWHQLRDEVIDVFRDALAHLAREPLLPRNETAINLKLFRLALASHTARLQSPAGGLLFNIVFNGTNQPLPEEEADDPRLSKMPDFDCVMKDATNPEPLLSQLHYYLESKRLGQRENSWVFNTNYAVRGVRRFVEEAWGYGKGCESATMIGYLQNMEPAEVIAEVNAGILSLGLPSLHVRGSWISKGLNELNQDFLTRTIYPATFSLGHLWIDIRHCPQDEPAALPPDSSSMRPRNKRRPAKQAAESPPLKTKKRQRPQA